MDGPRISEVSAAEGVSLLTQVLANEADFMNVGGFLRNDALGSTIDRSVKHASRGA